MNPKIVIRSETDADESAIGEVTVAAFRTLEISNHTEQFVIEALRAAKALAVSLVAEMDGRVVGHIAFSPVTISDGTQDWYGLGPVSVLPAYQRQGIGKALIQEGLSRLKAMNAQGCCLVGHLDYYLRLGFKNIPGLAHEGVPQEVFLALSFGERYPQGTVAFHEGFRADGQQGSAGDALRRDGQRWALYAAVAWSLIYAALGVYWAVGWRGFPYAPETGPDFIQPLIGRFGPGVSWIVVTVAGIPAATAGAAMLRGVQSRALRPFFVTAGALLAGALLLLMTSLDLLIKLGYVPYIIFGLITGAEVASYLEGYTQWTTVHQLLCVVGGFLWLVATVGYARRSGGACLHCGRRDGPEGWQGTNQAARWGRIAVYVAMVTPVFYALTRYAWALGFPLGMSEEQFRRGQESGAWISGLFLATFGLVGAVLMLGLVQRWGEVFPRWMIGLAGRRVPVALAVVPASLASVLLTVGGIGIWSGLAQMVAGSAAAGSEGMALVGEITFQVGPTLLFPVWGIALAVATLGYYYRRRGPCSVCGRGASGEVGKP